MPVAHQKWSSENLLILFREKICVAACGEKILKNMSKFFNQCAVPLLDLENSTTTLHQQIFIFPDIITIFTMIWLGEKNHLILKFVKNIAKSSVLFVSTLTIAYPLEAFGCIGPFISYCSYNFKNKILSINKRMK